MNKNYKALELNKILKMLSQETSCKDSCEKSLKIKPLFDLKEVQNQIQQTSDAHMFIARYGAPSFGSIKNVDSSLKKAATGALLSTTELLRISENLRIIRGVNQWREKTVEEGVTSSIDFLFNNLEPNKFLENKINSCIISEDEISDNASPTLRDIRRKINHSTSRARNALEKIINSSTYQKYLQETIITQRSGRYVVPVRAECKGNVPGLVHDTSSSGATVFVEPMAVVEANNDIKVLKSKEENEIERILLELSNEAGSFAESIINSYYILIDLDVIFAKAELGYKMNSIVPDINDKGIIKINKARHPLINKNEVVPTNIVLGKNFDTLVITGPNTGGKTVTLKTLGLLTIMTMCGLMIPASDNSQISVFNKILVDIGDEQSIEQSLSTFSAHMKNIIQIIESADNKSLVLIDELGAGTDPVEGAALAISILEDLRNKNAIIASTTHYAELKAYALETPGVENGSCEFDVSTLQPTYKLLIGIPGKSNAFAISKRLGMKDTIINRAKTLVSTESTRFENVVNSLEIQRKEMEQKLKDAEDNLAKASIEKRRAEQKIKDVEKQSEKEINKAKEEAIRITANAKAQAYSMLDKLEDIEKKEKYDKKEKIQLRRNIRQLEDSISPITKTKQKDYVIPRPLKAGDDVLIYDIDKEAVVLEDPKDSKEVYVQAGIIKTRVKLNNLRLLKKEKPNYIQETGKRDIKSKMNIKATTEISVRGLTAIEAIMEVDSAIDNAILANIETLTVIHGKGTGVLRREIHNHLRSHKSVKSYRLGVFGEGESGVTIINLK